MITRNSQTGEHKKHDAALRHRIRNLRAKVRFLLPMDLCCKQQKRSKNLVKIDHNRLIQINSNDRRWTHSKQNIQQLFIPSQPQKVERHLFEKLSNEEIEQIKEDKLYYVGQEFLDQFDQFLQIKEKQKNKPFIKTHKVFNQPTFIPQFNHKSSLSVGEDVNLTEKRTAFQLHRKRLMRVEEIKAKRKLMTQQDRTRRMYIKIKGRQKQQRYKKNYELTLAEKEQIIRQRNKVNMLKTAQSFQRKSNCQQFGQISELSEKLRNICLLRHSKSANLLFRQ